MTSTSPARSAPSLPAARLGSLAPHDATSAYLGVIVDGRYYLKRPIGFGDTHMLFEGHHVYTGQQVALKVLRPELADDDEWRQGLLLEARALTRARHRHVAALYDAGIDVDGRAYLAMELVAGRRLDGILSSRDRLAPEVAALIAIQLCSALDRTHFAGVLHGAIRPEHILIGEDDEGHPWTKLVGFGRAELVGEPSPLRGRRPPAPAGYLPPEQQLAPFPDPAADLYAIAATLYECIVGTPPHDGPPLEVLCDSIRSDVVAPSHLGCGPGDGLEAALLRALRRNPAERFPDARAFYTALRTPFPGGRAPIAVDKRRRDARAPYATPVRLRLPDGSTVDGRSEDISVGGLMVQIAQGIEVPARVALRFAPPGGGRVITLDTKVQWRNPSRTGTALGLAFEAVPAELLEAIASFVKMMGTDRRG